MQITHRGLIYSDDVPDSPTRVACYPSLARLSDGRILCVFRVGSTKDSADETLRIAQSCDEGRSWQLTSFEPRTQLGGEPGSLRMGHLVETQPEHLLLITCWVNRHDASAPIAHPQTNGVLELRLVAMRSEDGGQTWTEPEDFTHASPFDQPEVSGPVIALKEAGHFLLPLENQKFYNDSNPIDEKAYCLLSRDYGGTWNEWAMIAHRFPRYKHWCNRIARLPESGKLICFSWTFDEEVKIDLPIHLIHGSPDGKRWSQPVSSGVFGQLSTPLLLDENTLLMGYVHRHQPASIRLRKSIDGGRTWDADDELVIFSSQPNASTDGLGGDLTNYYRYMIDYTFGWTPMVRLRDGEVLMAYFAGTELQTAIHLGCIAL